MNTESARTRASPLRSRQCRRTERSAWTRQQPRFGRTSRLGPDDSGSIACWEFLLSDAGPPLQSFHEPDEGIPGVFPPRRQFQSTVTRPWARINRWSSCSFNLLPSVPLSTPILSNLHLSSQACYQASSELSISSYQCHWSTKPLDSASVAICLKSKSSLNCSSIYFEYCELILLY